MYLTKNDYMLWFLSVFVICSSFLLFKNNEYMVLCASLTGATSLIFCAKGNAFGQFLMIIFSLLYGIISYSYNYYGEMLTYMAMTAPMALFSLISWLKNPYSNNKAEVKVNHLSILETTLMFVLSLIVTFIFYFILKYFHTSNIFWSTISITTSFLAVYLTYRRSAYYALAYAANDIVLIILWILASLVKTSYISVVICFVIFFINDIYGFISWKKMSKRQMEGV